MNCKEVRSVVAPLHAEGIQPRRSRLPPTCPSNTDQPERESRRFIRKHKWVLILTLYTCASVGYPACCRKAASPDPGAGWELRHAFGLHSDTVLKPADGDHGADEGCTPAGGEFRLPDFHRQVCNQQEGNDSMKVLMLADSLDTGPSEA